MKTKFTVKIDLSARHILLMQQINDTIEYHYYVRDIEYLESKGLALAELDGDADNGIYSVKLTKLGKNILAEVESSQWTMQSGFVVTKKHIDVLRRIISTEYMNVAQAKLLDFTEVMEDMTGVNAPFPFLCHAGVAGGWVIMKYEDDTYPNYLEEAKNQIRLWDNRVRNVYLEFDAEEGASLVFTAGESEDDE